MTTTRDIVQQFYEDNFNLYVMRFTRQSGSPENAEDVVQEAFYRALLYSDSYNPEVTEFETWFNGIVKRSLIDFKRSEIRMGEAVDYDNLPEDEMEVFETPDPEMSEILEKEIEKTRLQSHRNILFLFYKRSYKLSEIAMVVGESYHTVRTVIDRFRRDMVERYGTNS